MYIYIHLLGYVGINKVHVKAISIRMVYINIYTMIHTYYTYSTSIYIQVNIILRQLTGSGFVVHVNEYIYKHTHINQTYTMVRGTKIVIYIYSAIITIS